jgi:FKBP-type peptidyl-prolyl cis-trans isomerase SlyD
MVKANKVVSIRFTLKNSHGEILEGIMNSNAVEYLHGSGNILPALEAGIEGLHAGDRKSITFNSDDSKASDKYYIDVIIDNVREATLIELQQGKPEPKPSDRSCGTGCCC